jgi:hypothetical protein
MNDEQPPAAEAGISTRRMETVVAWILFAIGALVSIDSYRLGARWGDDGPQSGYFPFYIGLLLCLSSVATLAQRAFTDWKHGGRFRGAIARREAVFVAWGPLKQVLSVLVPALAYVLAVQLVGIYVSSAAYIALFMVWLGRYSWAKGVAVGALTSIAVFLMFEVWFKVPLYKGLYDPLHWLGF